MSAVVSKHRAIHADPGLARHAQVVPSVMVPEIRGDLDCWVGKIRVEDLLRWVRMADMPESAQQDLCRKIVKRTRARADKVWALRTGVRLVQGWEERLSTTERVRMQPLQFTDERPLEMWTIRELKEGLKLPLDQVLHMLAKLEALYWVAPPASGAPSRVGQQQASNFLPLTAEVRQLAEQVLELPWLNDVTGDDLRFGYFDDGRLSDWLRKTVKPDTTEVSPEFVSLLRNLLAADRMTAIEEAHALAEAGARICVPRANDAQIGRWTGMLVSRYLSPSGAGRTLQEVGDLFDVTRERIRMVCEELETKLAGVPICTPALNRVLHAAARNAPNEVEVLDHQLRRFIGDGAGIESLTAWAHFLGNANPPIFCERVRRQVRGEYADLTLVQKRGGPAWAKALLRHVHNDIAMVGCTNVLRIAGRLAVQEEVAPGKEAIESALESLAGFRWLVKESGWFTVGDVSSCATATRVRKIMAVAKESVGADEIAGALASDDKWMYRETSNMGLATPPVHVLRELFLGWPWLRVVQRGRFVAADGVDQSGVLTEVEQACLAVIEANGGVACRFELKDVVMNQLGLTDVLLAAVLGSSPVFVRHEHGLYGAIGRRCEDKAVGNARWRVRSRMNTSANMPMDLAPHEFVANVTEASLGNEQYHLSGRHREKLAGQKHLVSDVDGNVVGEAKVTASGALSGLNCVFPLARPGDYFRIESLAEGLRVRHVTALDAPTSRDE